MDFSALPPEVISALIHAGPGVGSLVEASDAWQQLGANLEESAGINRAALSSLIEAWQGPSAAALAQAVEPYLMWLHTTAQQCRQIASSAQAAAAAFASVRASVVPLAQVSANRVRLAQLLATNMFGINLPAIAQTEDLYQGMWANNSAAMSRYQTESAQAATLPLFSSPPSIANPSGVAAQASAVSGAAAAAPASAVAPPLSPLDALLQSLGITFDPNQGWFGLANTYANQAIAGGLPVNLLAYLAQSRAAQALQSVGGTAGTGLSEGEAALGAGPGAGVFGNAGLSAETTAAVRVGVPLGKLTVPPAVVGLLPASHAPVQLAAAATPLAEADSSGFPLPPLMPPPISAGSGWRKRKGQKYEDDDDAEYEEDEGPAEGEKPAAPLGTGWRKRRDYDDIAYGVELPSTLIKPPPSAG